MTDTNEQRFTVEERPDQSRYVLVDTQAAPAEQIIGEEDYLDVEADADAGGGTQRILFHTGVSEAYGGQGLASVLVKAAVEDVIARGYKIVPVCPYVAKWLPKHAEYSEHVVAATPAHVRAVAAHQS